MGGKKQQRPYTITTPAQQLMRQDAARASREARIREGSEAAVKAILEGADRELRLHPSDWARVRILVRQGVKAGRQLERDL